jgi:hypothetical protein
VGVSEGFRQDSQQASRLTAVRANSNIPEMLLSGCGPVTGQKQVRTTAVLGQIGFRKKL